MSKILDEATKKGLVSFQELSNAEQEVLCDIVSNITARVSEQTTDLAKKVTATQAFARTNNNERTS